MPNSVWLIPPQGHSIIPLLSNLINKKLPTHFPPKTHGFQPHMTLTSNVPAELDPNEVAKWVSENIKSLPKPEIKFQRVDVGATFFTRVTLAIEKTPDLKSLAVQLRKKFANTGDEDVDKWGDETYRPHLSLVYHEMEQDEVQAKLYDNLKKEVDDAGVPFDKTVWEGGRVVVVNCHQPIDEWKILSEVELA